MARLQRLASRYSLWLELVTIFFGVLAFCLGFLDLDAATRLPGNESEVFQVLDWVLYHSVHSDGAFPLWNPYLQTGTPFAANPMQHVFNPLVSLPVLLLGVRAGFKLAVFLSFLAAALGMRQLGKALGLETIWRLWAAAFYTFGGQPAARFFQGEYLFIFGFAWLPWIFWALLQLLNPAESTPPAAAPVLSIRHSGRVYASLAAVGLALLFLSGNAYYAFYMLLFVPLYVITQTVRFQRQAPFVKVESRGWWLLFGTGILALALAAVQLIPTVEFWPWISKPLDIVGSHTPLQVFLDFTSRDPYRPDAYQVLPAREEYYAYIGMWPFLGLALFPAASLWRRLKRLRSWIVFLCLVCVIVVLWADLSQMPWQQFFNDIRFLQQFRALLRILIFGGLALILLAGLCLNSIWQQLGEAKISRRWVIGAAQAGLAMFMLLGVWDVFQTNRVYLRSENISQAVYDIAGWLRGQNSADDYVRLNPNNMGHDALIENRLRSVEGWYHFADIHPPHSDPAIRLVKARPVYLLQSPQESVDYYPDADLLGQVSGLNAYRLTQSLPLVFSVQPDVLQAGEQAGPLTRSLVTAQNWVAQDVNSIETIAEGGPGDLLVVLYTSYPGWKLQVDGQAAELQIVDGYLGAQMRPGMHKYTFVFQPGTFFAGLALSLLALAVITLLLLSGVAFDRAALRQRLKDWKQAILAWRPGDWLRRKNPLPVHMHAAGQAIFVDGKLAPEQRLDFPEGQRLHFAVDTLPEGLEAEWRRWRRVSGNLLKALFMPRSLEATLMGTALAIYLFVRLIGLTDWPIYFFTDEAVQTVMASDFVQQGLRNYDKELLPTYFSNGPSFNLSSVTVYVQVLPYLLFGKSVFVTRAVSVLISALGAWLLALILRDGFKLRNAWLGVLLLSITPAWFLHSRTAFEAVEMTAFYIGFLYAYLRYRSDQPRYLYLAIFFGALVFYTYNPGQLVMAVSGLLLFILDLPYHLRQFKTIGRGAVLLILLALPYLRYFMAHPNSLQEHLAQRAPYWLEQIPLWEKLLRYFQEYSRAFNPYYWFWPNDYDLVRHLMKGYGHISILVLPLFIVGLALVVRRLRQPAYRVSLVALLAAPSGSALVQINITRSLVMLAPIVLISALGLAWCLEWAAGRLQRWKARDSQPLLAGIVFCALAAVNFYMLADALHNGPLWYQDYTLSGMQYGGRQLFGAVVDYAHLHPDRRLLVSPVWTNGTDVVKRFFVPDNLPVELGSVTGYMFQRQPLDDSLVFVVVPEEFQQVVSSGKFKTVQVEQILSYPNGEPGFYFLRLSYVDDIDQILEAEHEQRMQLQHAAVTIAGQSADVGHSLLDIGAIENLFDGNEATLARTLEANPFVIDIQFNDSVTLNGLKFYIGGTNVQINAKLYTSDQPPAEFQIQKQGTIADPRCDLDFGQAITTKHVRIEEKDLSQGEPGHVHLWEIGFK